MHPEPVRAFPRRLVRFFDMKAILHNDTDIWMWRTEMHEIIRKVPSFDTLRSDAMMQVRVTGLHTMTAPVHSGRCLEVSDRCREDLCIQS